MTDNAIDFFATLERIVRQRIADNPDGSYTARLAQLGTRRIAQKVGEEAVELALAAVAGDRGEQLDEASDLFYHLVVLLHDLNISLADVAARLRERHTP